MTTSELGKIYDQYNRKVMGYIMARVQRRADAEDLCASVFEKVFRKIDGYDEDRSAIGTWIYTIARNTLIDYYRKSRPAEEIDENMPSDVTVDASLLREETLRELAAALRDLPQDLRDIVVLVYYERKPMTEIAEKMHISYGAVKLRHQKALAILRKTMKA